MKIRSTSLLAPSGADPFADPFADLARRLDRWRATRRRGQRIPAELWLAAARLARFHGLNRTSSALGLNYYQLKRHTAAPTETTPDSPAKPTFLELPVPASAVGPQRADTLEITRPRLSLRLPEARSRDLLPIVQAFLRS